MKTYLFVNPLSGHYSTGIFKDILENLHGLGIAPEVLQVRTPVEIASHCAAIDQEAESPLIVIAGGDGTINAVVNALTPGRSTIAILPFGTSNVLASEIGIISVKDGLKKIASGNARPFSVGTLELEGRSHRFLLMAGIGLDGAVVRDVWPLAKRLLRQGAYALSALSCAARWDKSTFIVHSVSGETTCHTAIICNASRYGGDFILSPGITPFSPGLSAVCITGNTRFTYLRSAFNLFRNRAQQNAGLIRIPASSFEIRGEAPIQIDGDFVGYGPARISECSDFASIIA